MHKDKALKRLPAALVLALLAIGWLACAGAQPAFRGASMGAKSNNNPVFRAATAAAVAPGPQFRAASSAGTNTASLSINLPAGTAANDVMIAAVSVRPSSASIGAPAGWTLVRRIDNTTTPSNALAVYRKVAGAGEPGSYAWNVTGATSAVGGIQAFSNVDTANPIDVENGQSTASSLSHSTPSVVTTVPYTMLVTAHSFPSGTTWTAPSGMIEGFDTQQGGAQAIEANYALQPAAGASGAKTATAARDPDPGATHILALRPVAPVLNISLPAGTVANDVMIAALGVRPSSATITAPAGWTLVRRINNTTSPSSSLAVYRKVAGAGELGSYAWDVTGATSAVGGIQAFSNVDTANPIDVENGQSTANSLSHSTPSVVTTVPYAMLVTAHSFPSGPTWTPPAGMIEGFDVHQGESQAIEGNYVLQPAAGATGAKTATAASDADPGNTHIVALRPVTPVLSINLPAGTLANDVLIAALGVRPSSATITVPSGWTLVRRIDNTTSPSSSLAVYRKVVGAGEPGPYAWGVSGASNAAGGIQAFSNVDTANPIDAENGQTTSLGLSHATPSITTTVANAMLVTVHSLPSGTTWTPPAGMAEGFDKEDSNAQSIEGNYLLQPAAGTSGAKTATAADSPDPGATHILALRHLVANASPTVSLTGPANGATFTAPASTTLTATAADTDGTIQKVEFFHGGTTLIATVTSPPYSIQWTGVAQGAYSLTAVATDNLNATTTSSPVNLTVSAAAALYFIHTDHLNTPRAIYDEQQQLRWKWEQQEPFGVNAPDEDPSSLGALDFALRYPGQYADRESNLYYNYFRDFDPSLARYVQSDPIGLAGGVNTFAYALGNPLSYVDPSGEGVVVPVVIGIVLIVASQSTTFQNAAANAASYWATQQIQTGNPALQNVFGTMGSLATLADPCNISTTTTVLSVGLGAASYLGRPFWQYYPAGNTAYSSPWITRGWGWNPPYVPGPQAASKLGLPPYNPATAVRPINPGPTQFVGGPGTVAPYSNPAYPGYFQPGGGVQYRVGTWPK